MKWFTPLFYLFISLFTTLAAQEIMLRDNMQRAQPGDYIVISSSKTLTLMHIYSKKGPILTIEEVSVPESKKPQVGWKQWISQNAPCNTSWVRYDVDLQTGQMSRYYSFTKRNWYDIPDADNFLSKLLNLRLSKIPNSARKRVGPKPKTGPEWRQYWQPPMVFEGQVIKGVPFDGWRTKWPRDGGELSGKTIEIFLPSDTNLYLSYFPYWLQVSGIIGKAKIRIIDSGKQMVSPRPPL